MGAPTRSAISATTEPKRTHQQAAQRLGVSPRRVSYRSRALRLRTIRTIGGSLRVLTDSLEELCKEFLREDGMNFVRTAHRHPHSFAFRLASLGRTALVAATAIVVGAGVSAAGPKRARLSADLDAMLKSGASQSVDVIVSGTPERIARIARRHGLQVKKALTSGAVFAVSSQTLDALSKDEELESLSSDADVRSSSEITTELTGAEAAWSGEVAALGAVDGAGVGVAILDSGISNHPALAGRVVVNVDFTNSKGTGADSYGHGTHVAGIVAAQSAKNPEGAQGMAPGAHLINLRVLDATGAGKASDVIEAIDWAIANKEKFAIRVLNLSLGSAPLQSVADDPLCQAVERAVRAGLVVVAAAGNRGETTDGTLVYGTITSPGTSPYAITVGALRTQGTLDSGDDVVPAWSSKGPTLVDFIVKPDLVAPGSKIVSTVSANSKLMKENPGQLIDGKSSPWPVWATA